MTDEEKKQETKRVEIYKEWQKRVKELAGEGKLPPLRSLTRAERKALDKKGINYLKVAFSNTRNPLAVQEECYDWIMDNAFNDFDFSETPNNVCFNFASIVYKMTYGDQLAEKN